MTRFQKLVAATVATTFVLVVIGVVVRATNSGVACPSWPAASPASSCPASTRAPTSGSSGSTGPWRSSSGSSCSAWPGWRCSTTATGRRSSGRASRPSRSPCSRPGSGQETVRLGNSGPSVTAHLATAMILFAVLIYALTRSFYPARIAGRGSSQRFTLLAAFGTVATYGLLLFGSNVTAGGVNAALVFNDWPLMGGAFFPPLTDLTSAQVLHRWVAVIVGLIVAGIALVAWRTQRDHPVVAAPGDPRGACSIRSRRSSAGSRSCCSLEPWTQTLHLALGAAIWGLLAAPRRGELLHRPDDAGAGVGSGAGLGIGGGPGEGAPAPSARSTGDTIRAYVALTKPRIIELLLVTTVPAMFLAARGWPRMDLVWWTLLGGSLAAGSANAINCYLDRDIDLLMTRTRRRPLPAHEVEPERAVVFGIVLGVIACVELAWFVNLVAAFLALLAIAFYVVVYTMILKRTTPQNIVIGGAAGALPPVIGWAAVTGDVGVPALILFALVFYWTPPHFWALSLRIRRDYAAAGVPMLPVVRGDPRDDPPDRPVHDPARGDLARALGGRPDGRDLPRGRGRPRGGLPVAGLEAVAGRHVAGALDRRRDRALQVLDHVPEPALPGHRGRRPGGHPGRVGARGAAGTRPSRSTARGRSLDRLRKLGRDPGPGPVGVGTRSSMTPSTATPVAAQNAKPVECAEELDRKGRQLDGRVREDHEAQLRDESHVAAHDDHRETDRSRTWAPEDEPGQSPAALRRTPILVSGSGAPRRTRSMNVRRASSRAFPTTTSASIGGGDQHRAHAESPPCTHVTPAFAESSSVVQASRGALDPRSRAGAPRVGPPRPIRRPAQVAPGSGAGRDRAAEEVAQEVGRARAPSPSGTAAADTRRVPARIAGRPVAAELAERAAHGRGHDRRERVVGQVARPVDELAAHRPPRPFGVRDQAQAAGRDLGPDVVRAPVRERWTSISNRAQHMSSTIAP